jgi:hypothetical protein
MKEKEIRDRIAQFLKKTARTVVVPASMGLGLSSAGCEGHSLHGKAADAGPDLVAQKTDAVAIAPDLADDASKNDLPQIMVPYLVAMPQDAAIESGLPEIYPLYGVAMSPDAIKNDLPQIYPPYVVAMSPDAALDAVSDALDGQSVDADRDASHLPLDVRADIASPPPPYLVFPRIGGDEPLGGAQGTSPSPLSPPAKK